jgi:hypothetical protein
VSGFTGVYDGLAHHATGTATGISGVVGDLNAHLALGAAFTNAPGGVATWAFGGDPNYHTATGPVPITINKATPLLNWPAPAPIAAGTPLSAAQLNATANVLCSFVYTPSAGTVLAEGTHSLSVAFTPADTINYNGASTSVNITVNAPANSSVQIVNPGSQSDFVGDDVRLQIKVNGGVASDTRGRGDDGERHGGKLRGTFTATGLPAGLRIEDDGEIRGRLTAAGNDRVTVTFTPLSGLAVATSFDWTVLPKPPKGRKG